MEGQGVRDFVVRLKRRRCDGEEAPSVLFLAAQRKRARPLEADEIHQAAERLRKVGLTESTDNAVSTDTVATVKDTAKDGGGKEEEQDQEGNKQMMLVFSKVGDGHLQKKRKVVELEVESKGNVKQRRIVEEEDEELDFGIWHAVTSGDMSVVKNALAKGNKDVNYQRTVDGVTILMAACSFCDVHFISSLLEMGADISLKDWSGVNARSRVGSRLPSDYPNLNEVRAQTFAILEQSEFVYDTYIIQEQIERETASSVWKYQGVSTAWQDAALGAFELDLEGLGFREGDDLVHEREGDEVSVRSSDYENEDDENYMYNDYPDEEEEEYNLQYGQEEGEDDDCEDGACALNRDPWQARHIDYSDEDDEAQDSDMY